MKPDCTKCARTLDINNGGFMDGENYDCPNCYLLHRGKGKEVDNPKKGTCDVPYTKCGGRYECKRSEANRVDHVCSRLRASITKFHEIILGHQPERACSVKQVQDILIGDVDFLNQAYRCVAFEESTNNAEQTANACEPILAQSQINSQMDKRNKLAAEIMPKIYACIGKHMSANEYTKVVNALEDMLEDYGNVLVRMQDAGRKQK